MAEEKKKTTTTSTTKAKAPVKTAKAPTKARKKPGPPKGKTNNPNGRPKGSKNKIQYDVRKMIFEKVADETFIKGMFDDIKSVKYPEARAKLKIELVKLFVPRPMNEDETKDRDMKSAIFDKLAGKKEGE